MKIIYQGSKLNYFNQTFTCCECAQSHSISKFCYFLNTWFQVLSQINLKSVLIFTRLQSFSCQSPEIFSLGNAQNICSFQPQWKQFKTKNIFLLVLIFFGVHKELFCLICSYLRHIYILSAYCKPLQSAKFAICSF